MVQQYFGIIGTAPGADTPAWAIPLKNFYDSIGIRTGHFYKGLTATFYNLNHMGYYAALCSMLFAALLIGAKRIWVKIMLSLICAYSFWIVVINDTFGCYLAVLATLVITAVFLIISKENPLKSLAPLMIFVLVSAAVTFIPPKGATSVIESNVKTAVSDAKDIYQKSESASMAGSGRWILWQNTVSMIAEKPLWGFGPDNLKKEYTKRDVKIDRAHCEILERAVSTGIPSAVLYAAAILLAICSAAKGCKHKKCKADFLAPLMATCAYFVSSMVGVFLFYTACHFFVMLAMLVRETN